MHRPILVRASRDHKEEQHKQGSYGPASCLQELMHQCKQCNLKFILKCEKEGALHIRHPGGFLGPSRRPKTRPAVGTARPRSPKHAKTSLCGLSQRVT